MSDYDLIFTLKFRRHKILWAVKISISIRKVSLQIKTIKEMENS